MSDLEEEHAVLAAAGDALEREHEELHDSPNDREAHAAHREKLREHIAALRAHIERLRAERSPNVL